MMDKSILSEQDKEMHHLFSLPHCIISEIVCEWIECGDQIRLDSAIGSTTERPALLDIMSSPQFVIRWPHELTPEESDERVTWASIRNARVASICLGACSSLQKYEQFLRSRGGSVFAVQVTDAKQTAENTLTLVSSYCTNMRTLVLRRTRLGRNFQNILDNCPSLNDLRIDNCSFLQELSERTYANLHTVVLEGSSDYKITASVLRMASNVQCLVLQESIFANLEETSPSVVRLAVTDTVLDNADLTRLARHCTNITHLSLDSSNIFNTDMIYAAEHMNSLTSINLSYCDAGDESLWALVQHRTSTLTELFLIQCYRISMDSVNYALEKCVNLRYFGVHCGDDADELDVLLLHRITRLVLIYSGNRGKALVKSIAECCVHLEHFSLYCVNYISPSELDVVLHSCKQLQSLNLQFEGLEGESFNPADVSRWKGITPSLEVGEKPELYDIMRVT